MILVSEDFEHFQAHKLVLASSSDFFMSAFLKLKSSIPVIFLHDMKGEEIKSLLQFIYEGKTQVPQENIVRFFSVAKKLKIKGLGELDHEAEEKMGNEKKRARIPLSQIHKGTREVLKDVRNSLNIHEQSRIIDDHMMVGDESFELGKTEDNEETMSLSSEIPLLGSFRTVKSQGDLTSSLVIKRDNYESTEKENRPKEPVTNEAKYFCKPCGKAFRAKNSLYMHNFQHHRK